MSQEKVDRYKEEKKNRAKTIKRAKIKKVVIIFLVALILGAAIGFPLGRWIYNYQQEHKAKEDTYIDSHDYEEWFNNYWVENYANLYTGAELTSEEKTTPDTSDTTEAGSTEAASTEAASTEAETPEAQ